MTLELQTRPREHVSVNIDSHPVLQHITVVYALLTKVDKLRMIFSVPSLAENDEKVGTAKRV